MFISFISINPGSDILRLLLIQIPCYEFYDLFLIHLLGLYVLITPDHIETLYRNQKKILKLWFWTKLVKKGKI